MIVEKRPLPDDVTPEEAPPAYYDVPEIPPVVSASSSEKSALTLPSFSLKPLPFQSKEGNRTSWFPFGPRARAAKQVRATVLDLLRDLVKQPEIGGTASPILESCLDACHSYGLSLSSLLQEPSVEGHTLIYWAIVNGSSVTTIERGDPSSPDLLSALLSLASPLTTTTFSDIRLACLHNSDHALFQRLRRLPALSQSSGTEEMLLGGSAPPDDIDVDDVADDECAFVARFRMPMFQKRLRVSKQINLEFIAQGRLWSLKFLVACADNLAIRPTAETGTWLVTLSLLEHSPPTWIDSRLIVNDTSTSSDSSSPPSRILPGSKKGKGKPAITLRLKTGASQLTSDKRHNVIAASFKDNQMAESLQYQGSSYIGPDGCLEARLEARLGKPDGECVIC